MALDGQNASVTTLAAAALESQGYVMQSKILDALDTPAGLQLVALLYLIGIITAIITIAIGGNYKFGRYLLVGPPLFFVLTLTRSSTDGAEWKFAKRVYDQAKVKAVLEGLPQTTNVRVSTFFHGWNLLTSDITQTLIEFLNLTERGSDINFIGKVERYMNFLMRSGERDPNLAFFMDAILINKCVDYYTMKRDIESPYLDQIQKDALRLRLAQRREDKVVDFTQGDLQPYIRWAQGYRVDLNGQYTCDEVWQKAIELMRSDASQLFRSLVTDGRVGELSAGQITQMLADKFRLETEHASGVIRIKPSDANLALLLNEIVARRLFRHMMNRSAPLHAYGTNSFGSTYRNAGQQQVSETGQAIGELNSTEQWQFRGDLLSGALSLPYFQGMVLFMLGMAFPFFAIMLVIPGKHHGFLLWMGLWTWVKSWDFGYAVVMMIDNMLYAMFPRGQGITNQELAEPGRMMMALMQIDPTYSANTYYNIVATCLLAVPVVTAVFVKKGANELVDAVTNGMTRYTTNIAGSLANYQRSMMAQTKNAEAQRMIFNRTQQGAWGVIMKDPEIQNMVLAHAATTMGKDFANRLKGQLQTGEIPAGAASATVLSSWMEKYSEGREKALSMRMRAQLQMHAYNASISPEVRRLASAAVRQKFNSHDFSRAYPLVPIQNAYLADTYFDTGGFNANTAKMLMSGRVK